MTGPQDPQQPDPSSGWEPVLPPIPPSYPEPGYGEAAPVPAQYETAPPSRPRPPRPDRDQRFASRPQPVWGGAISATGIVLAIFGIVLWSTGYVGDQLASSFGGGGSSHTWLGSVLSIAAAAGGYVLAASAKRGPLNTAGVTASAFAVPIALGFLTFGPDGSGLPFDLDAIVLVSVGIWLVSYFLVPGTRGHVLYLGLSAVVLWAYFLDKIAPNSLGSDLVSPFFGDRAGSGTGDLKSDLTTLAIGSLLVGALYYFLCFVLDRRGHHGVAQAFAFAGFPAVVGGYEFAAYPWGQVGVGVLLVITGSVLSYVGAVSGRRFTTWVWAAAAGGGAVDLLAKAIPDNKTAAGICLILIGALFVFVSVVASTSINEREYPAE